MVAMVKIWRSLRLTQEITVSAPGGYNLLIWCHVKMEQLIFSMGAKKPLQIRIEYDNMSKVKRLRKKCLTSLQLC